MKIVLLNDTHFGVRGDNQNFLSHFTEFFEKQFFPYLREHNIKTVFHLGDVVDRRKYINYQTLKTMREVFLEPLAAHTDDVHIIVGNHDVYNKNTNEVNALTELLGGYDFKLYTRPVHVHGCLLVPWICPDNFEESIDAIKTTNSKYCFGHFEIAGFEMTRGTVCEHGLTPTLFNRFDVVGSGHFHTRSKSGPIQYLGAPYEMTWGDADSLKGFSVFDTETGQLEFIRNPKTIFEKIIYTEDPYIPEIKDKYVRVIVKEKKNAYNFEKFIDLLETKEPADLKIIEEVLLNPSNDSSINQAEDTQTILKHYIDGLDLTQDKKVLTELIFDLYQEALTIRD